MKEQNIEQAITPLRLIFWGGILCVLDLCFSVRVHGRGMEIDILNDVLGAALIVVGVFRLRTIPVNHAYLKVMVFVQVGAYLHLLDAIYDVAIGPVPPMIALAEYLAGIVILLGIVAFCVAMRWFCNEARLPEAARSWWVTMILFVSIYFVPLSIVFTWSAFAIVSGKSYSYQPDIGMFTLLVIGVFFIPLIHLFVSTSRMKRAAEALVTH